MSEELHVLSALTDDTDSAEVEALLRDRWPDLIWQRVTDPPQLQAALHGHGWDLLVVGTEAQAIALQAIQENGWDRLCIAISATPESRLAAELLQAGVRAVVHKSGIHEIIPIVASEVGVRRDLRARRQADKDVVRSEARYRRLFEASQDGNLVLDASGAVTEVNPALSRLLDIPAPAILGRTAADLPLLAELIGDLDAVRGAGRFHRDGIPLRTAGGRTIWADIVAHCHDIDGEQIVQVSIRDVSERVQSEQGLSRANRALRTLSRANESLVHATDENALVADACRIIVEVGGFHLAWVGFAEPDGEVKIVARHLRQNDDLPSEPPYWPVDTGSLRHVLAGTPQLSVMAVGDGRLTALVLPLSQGRIIGAIAIVAVEPDAFDPRTQELLAELAGDLSYGIRSLRERALCAATEDALHDSETLFRTMAASASDALMVMDQHGYVTFWNGAAERMFGYSEQEAMGRHLHALVASEQDQQAHRQGMSEFSRSGTGPAVGHTVELMARRKDGVPFPVELTVSAINVRGHWHALGIVRDVSERKLAEERIHQADKMDALGNLAGGIAHDLKNMLFPVLSLIGLTIKELPEGSRQRLRLEKVLQATERARSLVERIHAFSHRDAVMRSPVDVRRAISEALGLIRPMLPATMNVREHLSFRAQTRIAVDQGQFDAIFMNFASNAVDALEGRPGSLTISGGEIAVTANEMTSFPVPVPGDYVWISVADTGGGMPQEILTRVFEPWFSTKGKGKGTGLGLAMVKKLVMEYGGGISVASTIGRGTTFTIYLPQIARAESMRSPHDEAAGPVYD
jgi:PAS domain S-box-containing protein